jgi:hypothetical protein
MKLSLHQLTFDGALLARGFWLYVWEITTKDGGKVHYVGRTGDSSSLNAQSPFARLSQHLGRNEKANALRRNLDLNHVPAEECRAFRLFACGPILPEIQSEAEHRLSRDVVAALEKALADAMQAAEYVMLNEITCRKPLDPNLWKAVVAVFKEHFPRL